MTGYAPVDEKHPTLAHVKGMRRRAMKSLRLSVIVLLASFLMHAASENGLVVLACVIWGLMLLAMFIALQLIANTYPTLDDLIYEEFVRNNWSAHSPDWQPEIGG